MSHTLIAGLCPEADVIAVHVYIWLHSTWSTVHCKRLLSAFYTALWCTGIRLNWEFIFV